MPFQIKCHEEYKTPLWVSENDLPLGLDELLPCVPGCLSCQDCHEIDHCVANKCQQVTCPESFLAGQKRVECQDEGEVHVVGQQCSYMTQPGTVAYAGDDTWSKTVKQRG